MCHVSDKLKLCTCAGKDVSRFKHYWIFYRWVKGRYYDVMGEAMAPYIIDRTTNLQNKALLLQLVNDGNIFDIELEPKQNDRLLLSFKCGGEFNAGLKYGFKYRNKQWVEQEYDWFEWVWKHEEKEGGKILNALEDVKLL